MVLIQFLMDYYGGGSPPVISPHITGGKTPSIQESIQGFPQQYGTKVLTQKFTPETLCLLMAVSYLNPPTPPVDPLAVTPWFQLYPFQFPI